MKHTVQQFKIQTELDVVLAYRTAMQLSEVCGLKTAAQTKFSTAVSEICRNVIEHVGLGTIELGLHEEKGSLCLEAFISDNGRGIPGLADILARTAVTGNAKGNGIYNSRTLSDHFRIESVPDQGTRVWIRKSLPKNQAPVDKAVIASWKANFSKDVVISPYAELKRQNQQLFDLLDQLRLRNLEVEQQIEEIQRLNQELENANAEVLVLLKQREESNMQLQQANRELDAFAYTVSHDLKAPLRNIEGLSAAIQDSLGHHDLDDAKHCTSLIVEQAQRMDKLIAGILDSARTGQTRLEKKQLALTPFLKNLSSNFTVPDGFLIQVQPNLPTIRTEELLLAQVMVNLLTNAIKHHDKNAGTISVTCQQMGSQLQFCVEDDGPGILPEHRALLFHPFASFATGKSVDSTGLGLSIVKRIIEAKGGNIWVESEGRGARFCFTWPVGESPEPLTLTSETFR